MGNEVTPIDVGAISVPLSSAMAARVSARARKHKQNLTEAVDALSVLAFRSIEAASIGGHKRWGGVSAEERSVFGRQAANARWTKQREGRGGREGADNPDTPAADGEKGQQA